MKFILDGSKPLAGADRMVLVLNYQMPCLGKWTLVARGSFVP